VYPDVTASRTTSRNLPDSTYGIVEPEDIAVRGAVMKTIYLSSVGSRKLPEIEGDQENLAMIQKEQREYGKTTGRPRPPKHISLPLLQDGMRFSGDTYLLPTHLDASHEDTPIQIIYRYTDEKTDEEKPYLPFQKEMNGLRPEVLVFQGWDGTKVKDAEHPRDLPENLQRLLAFYSRTSRKVAFGTYGPGLTDYLSWMPDNLFPRKKK
jgi:adenylosuccinate synthase